LINGLHQKHLRRRVAARRWARERRWREERRKALNDRESNVIESAMRVYGYSRVSTAEQADEGVSPRGAATANHMATP
jgi:hypothetical protein